MNGGPGFGAYARQCVLSAIGFTKGCGMTRILGAVIFCLALIGAEPPDFRPRVGFIPVTGGSVWYKILGTGKGTPVLLIHGGPGGRSCRMEPMAELLGRDRPVILYDQLGGGRSEHPADPSLWTVARFTREVDEVRQALNLKEVHLLGHSFGGTLVADYLALFPRAGIRSVVFSSPGISTPLWLEDAAVLRGRLPEDVQATLLKHERAGTTDRPEYLAAAAVYEQRHVFRSVKPDSAKTCSGVPSSNRLIYETLWGPAEFHCTGELRTFDRTPVLPTLRMPVLYLSGRHDEVLPRTLEKLRDMTPGAEMAILEFSGHLAYFEEKERYADLVRAFLGRADARPSPGGSP